MKSTFDKEGNDHFSLNDIDSATSEILNEYHLQHLSISTAFRECLREVLSGNNVTADRVRRFSRRARRYICCYFVLHHLHKSPNGPKGLSKNACYDIKF